MTILMLAAAVAIAPASAQIEPLPGRPPRPPRPPLILPPAPGEAPAQADKLVKVQIVSDANYVRPGQKFHLAAIYDIEPGWHIYWKNAGASGGPTEITVRAPHGYEVGKTLYPRPIAIEGPEGVTYGYERKAVLFVEVTAPVHLLAQVANFTVETNFMVCKGVCLQGRASQIVSVRAGTSESPAFAEPDQAPLLKEHRERLPKPISEVAEAQVKFEGGELRVQMPAKGRTTAQFFPESRPGVTFGKPDIKIESDQLRLNVPVTIEADNLLGKPAVIAGLVGLGDEPTEPSFEIEIKPGK